MTTDVAAELRAIAARAGVRHAEIARRMDVDPMWLSRRMSGSVPLTVDDMSRICSALEVDPSDVLAAARRETTTEGTKA